MTAAALIASTRFGFAARQGDLAAIGRDPRGWALRQLDQNPPPFPGDLPASAPMVAAVLESRKDKEIKSELKERIRSTHLAEVEARIAGAAESETPLLDRLQMFWANHFTVSGLRPVVRGFAGAFEREAIRPHMLGSFQELLLAVAQHPAMLFYLDNIQSFGPQSQAGRRQNRGLNENLGREILELHTLGVDGGYSQSDVEALAGILTGWSIAPLRDPEPGRFLFAPRAHEPGVKFLLGRTYLENGMLEGVQALSDIARHPSTARHVARKLATHFIADDPPQASVERIAKVFHDTQGDLKAVTAAVIRDEAVWREPLTKVRTPTELVIAAFRVTGVRPSGQAADRSLRVLDQPCFLAPSPAGWPDRASAWISPEAVLRRAEWCQTFANRLPNPPDPSEIARAAFGEDVAVETRQAVERASSRRMALALLLASPEFQRR